MQFSDLSKEQCEQLLKIVERQQAFMIRFLKRINDESFPPKDMLRYDVQKAFDALMSLRMNLHYMVGVRERKDRHRTEAEETEGMTNEENRR